jgi:hypothetical protein
MKESNMFNTKSSRQNYDAALADVNQQMQDVQDWIKHYDCNHVGCTPRACGHVDDLAYYAAQLRELVHQIREDCRLWRDREFAEALHSTQLAEDMDEDGA